MIRQTKTEKLQNLGIFLLFWTLVAYSAFSAPAILAAVLSLALVVMVHEFGHFIVAKLRGMRVEKFSIGFGPVVASVKLGETQYQIAALQLGGYVKPAGEIAEKDEDLVGQPKDTFLGQPWWSRALVLAAGPVMNFIFPVAALFLLYLVLGRPYPFGPPVVSEVLAGSGAQEGGIRPGDQILKVEEAQVPAIARLAPLVDKQARAHPDRPLKVEVLRKGKALALKVKPRLNVSRQQYLMGVMVQEGPPPYTKVVERAMVLTPAEKAGFKAGDEVLSVGGKPLKDALAFGELFAKAAADPVAMVVRRGGKELTLTAPKKQPIPEGMAPPELVGLLGLEFKLDQGGLADRGKGAAREKLDIGQAFKLSLRDNAYAAAGMVMGLWQLVRGKLSARESLGGPVAIVRMAHQQAQKGWEDLLQLACNISLILGIMNLLPVPLLDGGTLVFCAIEGLRGKPLPLKVQAAAQNVGLTLIGALFVFTFANDLLRLFGI